jgi:hypothetical protein
MRLHYFDKADIPCLINRAAFAACGFDFDVQKKEDSFTIEVKSKVALPAHLEVKIEETIRFLLAQTVSLRALEGPNHHLQLYSRYPSSPRTRLGPPISRGGPAFNDHSWQLFAAYLAYVLPGAEPYWHTCSNHLHTACEAQQSFRFRPPRCAVCEAGRVKAQGSSADVLVGKVEIGAIHNKTCAQKERATSRQPFSQVSRPSREGKAHPASKSRRLRGNAKTRGATLSAAPGGSETER